MPLRVAFVSPSGLGNLGDAAIIDSLIAGVRQRRPEAEIVGFTLNPDDTRARHGVEAYTCAAFSRPHYTVRRPRGAAPADDRSSAEPRTGTLRRSLAAVPGARQTRRLASMLLSELRQRRLMATRLVGFDHVVVAGGGQIDEFWGGPFGHPYTLYRFGRAARRAGARFDVLSVGTGTLATRLGRRFVRLALNDAHYRSFRDERSRELAVGVGAAATDTVVPDLAYGLPLALTPQAGRARKRIGIAPMCYADPRVWPKPDAARYARHLEAMAAIAVGAVHAGYEISMFGTDRPDTASVTECHELAARRLAGDERARLQLERVSAIGRLMALLANCDAVVAARLHGVLLAHVVGCPVLAIAHDRKVSTLMSELGHDSYCMPIDDTDPIIAGAALTELLARGDAIKAMIRASAADRRRRVEAQYDALFRPRT